MDKQPVDQKSADSGSNMFRRLIRMQFAEDVGSHKERSSLIPQQSPVEMQGGASFDGMSSGIGGDCFMGLGEYVGDPSALLSLQPWVFRKGTHQNDDKKIKVNDKPFGGDGYKLNGLKDMLQAEDSPRSLRLVNGLRKGRNSLKSRRFHGYSVRPISSTGNCLIPQLYDEHFEIQDYVLSSSPSQKTPTMKPLVITDGQRIISKSTYDCLGEQFANGLQREFNELGSGLTGTLIGAPSLPELRKPKCRSREVQHEKLDISSSRRFCKLLHSEGSPDKMLLFTLGISFGVLFTILANKREVEKLNDLLEDSKNFVQDLQEELEMKESLTVRELVNEACEGQETNAIYANVEKSIGTLHIQVPASYCATDETYQYYDLQLPKAVAISDSMSKIEAELEAELERLELNMNTASLGGVFSLDELDADLAVDVVHGELRADMLEPRTQECHADVDQESSTTTGHDQNPNYAVSPRELSLRLHEVVQYRLEERVKELEKELQHSKKQLQFMETEHTFSQEGFTNSDIEYSNPESPITMEQDGALANPLFLNLSGEALDAYDEAYEEFMQMTDTEDTRPSSTDTCRKPGLNDLHPCNQSLVCETEGNSGSKSSKDVELRPKDDNIEEGDKYEIDDEEGRMIQRIVARTKQGSPIVMHVQGMLFSMDE